jgi:hypothetical protein
MATKTTPPAGGTVAAAGAGPAVIEPAGVKFTSPHASLVVYSGGKKIATFEHGVFITDNDKVVAVLRGHELVQESDE